MRKRMLTSLALLTLAGSLAQAQTSVRLAVRPDSKLWLEGGSNLHSWECSSTAIDATIDVDPSFKTASNFPKALQKVEVKLPVTSLKCGHGAMEKNMYKALKADKAPAISYILGTFEAQPGEAKDFTVTTVGRLTVAGEERTVKMDVTAERLADGTVKAKGTVPILMTDFGIQPPTAMFGALKTDNKVIVKFELLVNTATAVASK